MAKTKKKVQRAVIIDAAEAHSLAALKDAVCAMVVKLEARNIMAADVSAGFYLHAVRDGDFVRIDIAGI